MSKVLNFKLTSQSTDSDLFDLAISSGENKAKFLLPVGIVRTLLALQQLFLRKQEKATFTNGQVSFELMSPAPGTVIFRLQQETKGKVIVDTSLATFARVVEYQELVIDSYDKNGPEGDRSAT